MKLKYTYTATREVEVSRDSYPEGSSNEVILQIEKDQFSPYDLLEDMEMKDDVKIEIIEP